MTGHSSRISGNQRAAEAPIRETLTSWQVYPHRPHSHKPETQRQPTRLSVVSQQSLTSNTRSHQVGGVFDLDTLGSPQLLASTRPQRLGTRAPGCPPTCLLLLRGHPAPGRPPCPVIPTDHTPSVGTHETPASPSGAHCWKAVQGCPGGPHPRVPMASWRSTERGHSVTKGHLRRHSPGHRPRSPELEDPAAQPSCCRGPCLPWVGGGHTAAGAPPQAGSDSPLPSRPLRRHLSLQRLWHLVP